ncbi:MAG: molybdopterin molybdotransferase MoeA [Acidimicrobiales bacterium]|nr:molybdopterin molybdotransferase MoeA [Acidimicrobiales bacterium]
MISLDEARATVLAGCVTLAARAVPLADARGCVLATAVVAPDDVPPFDNSAMDGFAVRAHDTRGASPDGPVVLRVVDTVAAGQAPSTAVEAGTAVRIMTGAPVPDGADAVVMVEATELVAGGVAGAERVAVHAEVAAGQHLRRAGDDVTAGSVVLEPPTVLGAAHLGVLASVGADTVDVIPRPVVGVLSTGDELVEAGRPLAPGQIRDSNRVALCAAIELAGAVPVDLGLVADDEALVTAAIEQGVQRCDLLITSGGVSMGDFDYVKVVLDRLGAMRWMQVAIRPAKPLAFGVVDGGDGRPVPVLGLPGNPVSSLVSFELFGRPALRRLAGWPGAAQVPAPVLATAGADLARRPDGKVHLVRVRTEAAPDGTLTVMPAAGQGSHQLAAMAGAQALAVLPDGSGVLAGSQVEVLVLPT